MQEEPSRLKSKGVLSAPEAFFPLIVWGLRDELKALKEGMQYACSPANRCFKDSSFSIY